MDQNIVIVKIMFSRVTNDDREEEMEENMQLVNTMIGKRDIMFLVEQLMPCY